MVIINAVEEIQHTAYVVKKRNFSEVSLFDNIRCTSNLYRGHVEIPDNFVFLFRNVQSLINALEPVLDDGAKLQMLHYLSELLPEAEQQAFDRAAARMISRKMDSM